MSTFSKIDARYEVVLEDIAGSCYADAVAWSARKNSAFELAERFLNRANTPPTAQVIVIDWMAARGAVCKWVKPVGGQWISSERRPQ